MQILPALLLGLTPVLPANDGEAVLHWQVTSPLPAIAAFHATYPHFTQIFGVNWSDVESEEEGWMILGELLSTESSNSTCAWARTLHVAAGPETLSVSFFHEGDLRLFLNGASVLDCAGQCVGGGEHSDVELHCVRGVNELFIKSLGGDAGWSFAVSADKALVPPTEEHHRAKELWRTPAELLTPECVLHDPERDLIYVSSFDSLFQRRAEPMGFISRLTKEGEIVDLHWITDLNGPCGMAQHEDRLYLAERAFLTEIDVESGEILARYPAPSSTFLNDVTVSPDGDVFVTDTSQRADLHEHSIWRLEEGELRIWLEDPAISRANGLLWHKDLLLTGNTGDGALKAIDLRTERVFPMLSLGAGVVDGIQSDGQGGLLVSHWEGQLYHLSISGELIELLDLQAERLNIADFEYIPEARLLLVPTFGANCVIAYELDLPNPRGVQPPPSSDSALEMLEEPEIVLPVGGNGAWDSSSVFGPRIVEHGGLLHMFYVGNHATNPAELTGKMGLGYATSKDGREWTKQGDGPALVHPELGRATSCAPLVDGENWIVLFSEPGVRFNGKPGAFLAIGEGPLGPWDVAPEPVLVPDPQSWAASLMPLSLIAVDGEYRLYFAGRNPAGGLSGIGLATSKDLAEWRFYDDPATTAAPFACSDPILLPGEPDSWDGVAVTGGSVSLEDGNWELFYIGYDRPISQRRPGDTPLWIGRATSSDGVSWSKDPGGPVLRSHERIWPLTSVVRRGGEYVFFQDTLGGRLGISRFSARER